MTIRVQQSVNQEQTPLVRTAIERLLQEAGSTEHLDLSRQHLQGVTLVNGDLRGANLRGAELTWAYFGGAGTYAPAKQDLQRRGAFFREGTQVHCVVSRSDETDGYALGVVLGILVMSTVTFLFGRRVRSMLKQGSGTDRPRGGHDRS